MQKRILVEHGNAERYCLVVFAARSLTCDNIARLLRHASRHLRAARFKGSPRLVARHPALREASRQHEGQPCKRLRQRVFRCGLHVVFQRHAVLAEPLDHSHVVGCAEEQVHAARDLRTHALDRGKLLLACRHERIDRRERRSERFRHCLSHMANPQAEQRPGERARAALVDRRHELLRHGLAQADWRAVLVHAPHVEH